jgi:hypothetical protein
VLFCSCGSPGLLKKGEGGIFVSSIQGVRLPSPRCPLLFFSSFLVPFCVLFIPLHEDNKWIFSRVNLCRPSGTCCPGQFTFKEDLQVVSLFCVNLVIVCSSQTGHALCLGRENMENQSAGGSCCQQVCLCECLLGPAVSK